MTHEEKFRNHDLDSAVQAMRDDVPSTQQVEYAGARVWSRLQNQDVAADVEQIRGCEDVRRLLPAFAARKLTASRTLLVEDHLRECLACRSVAHTGSAQVVWEMPKAGKPKQERRPWGIPQFAFAAAAVLVVTGVALFTAFYFQSPSGPRARIQSAQGAVYRVTNNGAHLIATGAELSQGELVRTAGGAHAFVRLRDGSIVEMSERSEFSVTARRQDTTVHLDEGRIIVQAAHRRVGHLYVDTPDAKVAVTGTVFAVNAGMKGSRVSVIEGTVRVAYNGTDAVLHSGDQANTSSNLTSVPVAEDISWSRNLDQHLALLAEFAKLKQKFAQIPTPGLRYSSAVLDKLPSNTVFYASIPNLGEALNQANNIFQNELQQSPVLREWWNNGRKNPEGTPTFNQMVQKLHGLSQYLGDEIVIAGFTGPMSGSHGTVLIAPIKAAGLKQFMQNEFTDVASHDGQTAGLRILGEADLASAVPIQAHELTAVVGDQYLLISPTLAAIQRMDTQLNSGSGGFAQTPFGQHLADAYNRGAGLLFGVDLRQIMALERTRNVATQPNRALLATGFNDADYLLVEAHEGNGAPDNRAVLTFTGPRHGMASWLAQPNPIGSLDFVSANAGAAFSFLSKDPALMFDDLMAMVPDAQRNFSDVDTKLNVDIRNDIAASLGGDFTFALDGPVLPKPAWKFILQVNDSSRLQYVMSRFVQAINAEASAHGRPGIELTSSNIDDRTFYRLVSQDATSMGMEIDYTYADGYLVAGPSRAIVQEALRTKSTGDTLARSSSFQSLLPKDGHVNFSAVAYENLAPLLQPLASELTPQQLQTLQQIAASSKPTAICAYAGPDRIEVASSSELLPFDINSLSLGTLLGHHKGGTSAAQKP